MLSITEVKCTQYIKIHEVEREKRSEAPKKRAIDNPYARRDS